MFKSALTAAAVVAAALSLSASAEAKGGHGGHHHHWRGYGFYAAPVYVAPVYSSCGYALANWQATGSFYWKKRYYACKGWW